MLTAISDPGATAITHGFLDCDKDVSDIRAAGDRSLLLELKDLTSKACWRGRSWILFLVHGPCLAHASDERGAQQEFLVLDGVVSKGSQLIEPGLPGFGLALF